MARSAQAWVKLVIAPDRISRIGVAYIDSRDGREALRIAVQVACESKPD